MVQESSDKQRLNLSLDLRWVVLALLAIIAAMLLIWKPWAASVSSDRTIDVVGEAVVKAEPDEFVFYPAWEFKDLSNEEAMVRLSDKSDEVVAKLKELGIEDNKIKSNSDSYDKYFIGPGEGQPTYTLRLEVRVGDKELAQKVQDYLLTTGLTGQISPQTAFSDEKRRELESQARDQATKDARSKADQSANNLGFSIGRVKSVKDGTGFGDIEPMIARDTAAGAPEAARLQIQPGESEVRYTVSVSYYVK